MKHNLSDEPLCEALSSELERLEQTPQYAILRDMLLYDVRAASRLNNLNIQVATLKIGTSTPLLRLLHN